MAEPRIEPAEFEEYHALVQGIANRYHTDPAVRSALAGDARTALVELGMKLPEGVEIRVAANTPEVTHLVMPPDPNVELGDEALSAVAGGSTTGTASSAGTLSTAGTIPGTFSTAGTAGTVATAGSS
jgi:hypothetical protein